MLKEMSIRSITIKIRNKVLSVFGDILLNKHFPWIPYYKPEGYEIRGKHVRKFLDTVQPGDVLLRGYDDYLDGKFIGHWSHAAIVYNKQQAIHSIAEGVGTEDLIDFSRCDRILILRPTILDEADIKNVLKRAQDKIGCAYDFGFNFNDPKEMCCTEFVYYCFEPYSEVLGMFKEVESFYFITKQTVRPTLFTNFIGFKKISEFPQGN